MSDVNYRPKRSDSKHFLELQAKATKKRMPRAYGCAGCFAGVSSSNSL
jgi:hypothetical protein